MFLKRRLTFANNLRTLTSRGVHFQSQAVKQKIYVVGRWKIQRECFAPRQRLKFENQNSYSVYFILEDAQNSDEEVKKKFEKEFDKHFSEKRNEKFGEESDENSDEESDDESGEKSDESTDQDAEENPTTDPTLSRRQIQ